MTESQVLYGLLCGVQSLCFTHCFHVPPFKVFTTSLWFMTDPAVLTQHVNVVRIYVLSPFLYGHAHQSDRWLKWCHEVGMLTSDV